MLPFKSSAQIVTVNSNMTNSTTITTPANTSNSNNITNSLNCYSLNRKNLEKSNNISSKSLHFFLVVVFVAALKTLCLHQWKSKFDVIACLRERFKRFFFSLFLSMFQGIMLMCVCFSIFIIFVHIFHFYLPENQK